MAFGGRRSTVFMNEAEIRRIIEQHVVGRAPSTAAVETVPNPLPTAAGPLTWWNISRVHGGNGAATIRYGRAPILAEGTEP